MNKPRLSTLVFRNLPSITPHNGLETKISRTFLDFLHLGHEFFVILGHGT